MLTCLSRFHRGWGISWAASASPSLTSKHYSTAIWYQSPTQFVAQGFLRSFSLSFILTNVEYPVHSFYRTILLHFRSMAATVPSQVLVLIHTLARIIQWNMLALASVACETGRSDDTLPQSIHRRIEVAYEQIVDMVCPFYIVWEPHDALVTRGASQRPTTEWLEWSIGLTVWQGCAADAHREALTIAYSVRSP